ncbi:MAG: hypothetical protein Q3979_09565 [Actinomycetaceae bacterium]|nr:hypothetical protein [Actinomycetaceae bacterium]
MIRGPGGHLYLCAADGEAWSISSKHVTAGSVKEAKFVDSISASSLSAQGDKVTKVTVTNKTQLAQMAWIASMTEYTDNTHSAGSQIALTRVAGVFKGSIYERQEQGTFPAANGDNLNAPLAKSKEIVEQAKKFAGPYTVKPAVKVEGSTGTVTAIGAKSAAGNWMAGVNYKLEVTGPATLKSNGQTTVEGVTKQQELSEELNITGSGEVRVKLTMENLPTTKPKVAEGNNDLDGDSLIAKGSRAQNFIAVGQKEALSGEATATAESTTFAPKVTTEVQNKVVKKGDGLVDKVTASYDGTWPTIEGTNNPLPLTVTVDVYGPFATPVAPSDDASAFANKKVGTYNVEFTKAGTKQTDGSVKATGEGFYFFHERIVSEQQGQYADQIKAYESKFFQASETSVVQSQISISTKASKEEIGDGKYGVKDTVKVSGLPEDHGDFAGLGEWKADAKTISHKLYFVASGTELKEGVTKDLKALATVETPAKNGDYTIEAKDFPINPDLGDGTYVVVSTFAGDARVAALTTSDADKNEQVTVSSKKSEGRVRTQAFTESGKSLKPGDKIGDTVIVEGDLPEGSYTEVSLYRWELGATPVCDTPIWKSERVEHSNKAGQYKTNLYTTEANREATYGFVETTYDPQGNQISQAECGVASETLEARVAASPENTATSNAGGGNAPGSDGGNAPSANNGGNTSQNSGGLARTGASVTTLAGVALLLVLLGAAGVIAVRHHRKA